MLLDIEQFEGQNYRVNRKVTAPAGHLLHELMIRLSDEGGSDAIALMHASGLTLPQMIVLGMLRERGAQPISSLATRTRLSMSAASALVQRLVDDGLVTRREDPADRRQKQVALSRAGAQMIERLSAGRAEALARGLARLPATLRGELIDVLARCVAHLREHA